MNWFKRNKPKRKPPSGPRNKRLYAIGDVHGCLDELKLLLAKIEADAAKHDGAQIFVVFIGDLIDRGPDSAGVMELVANYTLPNGASYCLCGNHEEMFLRALNGDFSALEPWLDYGGRETLLSYGLSEATLRSGDLDQIWIAMKKAVPKPHKAFLENLHDSIEFGDFFLVHAGVDPKKPLKEQARHDFLWMREPFLSHASHWEKTVIHGHTIQSDIELHPHRIGIDTGAYNGGPLSAIAIQDENISIIQHSSDDFASISPVYQK